MDMNKLRARMFERNMNVTKLAERVGISRTAFYRKLQKPGQFTVGEVMRIKSILGLSEDDAIDIFFN